MIDPTLFYKSNITKYQTEVSSIYKRLTSYSFARLLVFVATAIGGYFTFGNWQFFASVLLVGIVSFIYLLSKHTDLKKTYNLKKELVAINEEEIKIGSGDFFHKNEGKQFHDSNHNYELDIDLFGRGSFFQFIDRAAIETGKLKLANALKANDINTINLRQEAIKN